MTPLTIRNDWPIVGWVFGGLWLFGLVVFTWFYARDGGFNQFDPAVEAGVMLLFWMFGMVVAAETVARSCMHLTIEDGCAVLIRTWLWRRRREILAPSSLRDVEIQRGRDSDGDPYYKLVLTTGAGEPLVLSESSTLAFVESRRDAILARL